MPKLKELRRKERTINVDWYVDDQTVVPVQVTYDPNKITMGSQDVVGKQQTLHDYWQDRILDYVVGWDLMEDSGEKLPITKDGIAQLDINLVQAILGAINGDNVPNLRSTTNT